MPKNMEADFSPIEHLDGNPKDQLNHAHRISKLIILDALPTETLS